MQLSSNIIWTTFKDKRRIVSHPNYIFGVSANSFIWESIDAKHLVFKKGKNLNLKSTKKYSQCSYENCPNITTKVLMDWGSVPTAVQRKVCRRSLKNPQVGFVMKHTIFTITEEKRTDTENSWTKNSQLLTFLFVFLLPDHPKNQYLSSAGPQILFQAGDGASPADQFPHYSLSLGNMSFTIQSDRYLCHHLSKNSGEFQWCIL